MKYATPKAAAKLELLFNKPASVFLNKSLNSAAYFGVTNVNFIHTFFNFLCLT